MRIILLDKINNLGNIGEEVNVKSGYARNFLIPTSKAVLATKKNIEYFNARRVVLEENVRKVRFHAESCVSEIEKLGCVTIRSRSGIAGKLFGSIGSREISDAIIKSGINISRRHIRLPSGKIRYLGDYNILIQIYHEISTTLNVRVVNIE